ncbi:hypothetical protein BAUCODRAFT_412588 [Baudoinia panamericana UAMH 10762]|uniref:BRCT domain-containing protein n=1 Tax=Baudoinia panamericana (strain UAMH 10762) TaxID=717646 RepID=M2MN33_BAUPA|nr:uncharacterized protein BAUCODRAFT_412588 [Baudoinia panamericana UAMH 10762]EMC98086.1 hypothetical protein BAUCODRAFT_412588 [Baudoinia panamericana UAMH 10762]
MSCEVLPVSMADGVEASVRNDQFPLRGVVLCCTSLLQDVRTRLTHTATELGAVVELDLTKNCTHLIVGSVSTPKYRYVAKDRPEVRVLCASWIEAVRQAWVEGGNVDLSLLEEKHRLPAFFGLKICVTGFDNLEQRNLISDTVAEQGAEYHGDLTKNVTHLIAATPSGAKYAAAKAWGLIIVSYKWFEDSLFRGMALDESLYDPARPDSDQGRGAFRTTARPRESLGKRGRDGESQENEDTGKRKLRRTASTRLNSQSQDVWQDLSAREAAHDDVDANQWKDENYAMPKDPERPNLVSVQVRRSDAFQANAVPSEPPRGLFSGLYIMISGFPRDRMKRLRQYLEPNGASIVSSERELEAAVVDADCRGRYLLVPHTFEGTPPELPDIPQGTEMVTEWWVERCIHSKALLEPQYDMLSTPMWDAHIPELSDLTVCITGFGQLDFRQVAESIKLMGATYAENLDPSVSVLVSGSETVKKEKAYYATKHSIPVVSAAWLYACLRAKRRASFEEFLLKIPTYDQHDAIHRHSMSSPAASGGNVPGPGRNTSSAAPKRLSKARRHATPTLPLQGQVVRAPQSRTRMPFTEEDDDSRQDVQCEAQPPLSAKPTFSPSRPRPLQERSPNASPRKGNHAQTEDHDNHPKTAKLPNLVPAAAPETASMPVSPPRSPLKSLSRDVQSLDQHHQDRLTSELAAMVERQHSASRPDSASAEAPLKRKNRPLGRSLSGIGHRAVSASAQSDHSTSSRLNAEPSDSIADGYDNLAREDAPPVGTQLGYETPDTEAHRSLMEKRMKVNLRDDSVGKRAASIGTVKDSFVSRSDNGMSDTVRARRSKNEK